MIPLLLILVRKLRPLRIRIGVCLYLCYRLSNLTGPSLLERLVESWNEVVARVLIAFGGDDESSCHARQRILLMLLSAFGVTSTLFQDLVAIWGILGLLRSLSRFFHLSRMDTSEWKDQSTRQIFQWISQFRVPGCFDFQNEVEEAATKILKDADSMLGKDPKRIIRLCLPTQGLPNGTILQELESSATKENDRCETGRVSGTMYVPYSQGKEHSELMTQVYGLYQWANPLKPGVWPRVNQCEAEIIAMTANILNAPPTSSSSGLGCVTSGGTESIFTAVRAHLELYGKRRGILNPEIICGSTAHCALNKACEVLNIRLVCIDCNDGQTYELKAKQVRKYVTSNTIMIFASAPSWPQGVIDPIDELSKLAIQFDIGLHVDACLGGFVLPFCDYHIVPQICDFRLLGVTSISADTHKYGYATKGTSVVIFRSLALQHASYFTYSRWSGGLYVTPAIAGSRPGSLIVCAWAALVSIGGSGYRTHATSIVNTARKTADTIRSIRGLKLLTPSPTMIVAFGSDKLNIYRIKDVMSSLGWSLNPLQNPAGLNICVTENFVHQDFLKSLIAAVDQVRTETQVAVTKGTSGISCH
mmetsp:Transcript_25944/g.49208  ORF Transcript_25944/g.49208 Transcript_25944/m.49208 type:complete len:588 (+) Transcript_25944:237-2000(+)